MLTQYIRVFRGADLAGVVTLEDLSMDNAEKVAMEWEEKYFYVAQRFPFNNLFLMFTEKVNTESSTLMIEYWNGASEWVEAKDILDFTRGLARNGLVQFSLNNNESWDCISRTGTDDTNAPLEMRGLDINDCHWIRISCLPDEPSNTVTIPDDPDTILVDESSTTISDVELKHICYAFTTTEKVNGVDIQMPRHYTTFLSGKTNWLDEILIGSEMMIADLKTAGMLKSHGQIILLDDFYLPCAYRVLMHLYSQMGTAYEGKRGEITAAYNRFLKGPKTIDVNMDAKISSNENQASTNRIRR
jgi:hypothetical protein